MKMTKHFESIKHEAFDRTEFIIHTMVKSISLLFFSICIRKLFQSVLMNFKLFPISQILFIPEEDSK